MLEFGRRIRNAGEEEGSTLGSEEDASVARLSLLVFIAVSLMSGVEIFLHGTTTDTPDVDVDALSILGRSTRILEVDASGTAGSW